MNLHSNWHLLLPREIEGIHRAILVTCLLVFSGFHISASRAEITCLSNADENTEAFENFNAEYIDLEHAPWMVNLSLGGEPFCGGAIVDSGLQFVITAAHCVKKYPKSDLWIRIAAPRGGYSGESRRVVSIRSHPRYYDKTKAYDVAVVKLDRAYSHVEPSQLVPLLPKDQAHFWAKPGDCARVMGWGKTTEYSSASEELLQVDVRIWPQSECKNSNGVAIGPHSLCAGYYRGGFDSCGGDSGGPLLVQGGNFEKFIVGIVSWGRDCGRADYPGVYTRVSEVRDWVYGTIKEMSETSN